MERQLNKKAFIPNKKYVYKIVPIYAQNLAIEIKDGKTNDGTNIELGESKDVAYQYFKIILDENNKYIFEPAHCSESVIDIRGMKMKNKTNIHLYHKNGTDAQYFHIEKSNNDAFLILAAKDENYALDVHSKGNKTGANIQLFKKNNSESQQFLLLGRKNIFAAFDYALKYSTERNPEYKNCKINCANFCSQCLLAGGIEPDIIWNKDSESFIDPMKLQKYFFNKGVEWIEYPNIRDYNPGDIAYMINKEKKFDHPIFIIKIINEQIIFCGNSMDIKEGSLNYTSFGAVLQTSSLFKHN